MRRGLLALVALAGGAAGAGHMTALPLMDAMAATNEAAELATATRTLTHLQLDGYARACAANTACTISDPFGFKKVALCGRDANGKYVPIPSSGECDTDQQMVGGTDLFACYPSDKTLLIDALRGRRTDVNMSTDPVTGNATAADILKAGQPSMELRMSHFPTLPIVTNVELLNGEGVVTRAKLNVTTKVKNSTGDGKRASFDCVEPITVVQAKNHGHLDLDLRPHALVVAFNTENSVGSDGRGEGITVYNGELLALNTTNDGKVVLETTGPVWLHNVTNTRRGTVVARKATHIFMDKIVNWGSATTEIGGGRVVVRDTTNYGTVSAASGDLRVFGTRNEASGTVRSDGGAVHIEGTQNHGTVRAANVNATLVDVTNNGTFAATGVMRATANGLRLIGGRVEVTTATATSQLTMRDVAQSGGEVVFTGKLLEVQDSTLGNVTLRVQTPATTGREAAEQAGHAGHAMIEVKNTTLTGRMVVFSSTGADEIHLEGVQLTAAATVAAGSDACASWDGVISGPVGAVVSIACGSVNLKVRGGLTLLLDPSVMGTVTTETEGGSCALLSTGFLSSNVVVTDNCVADAGAGLAPWLATVVAGALAVVVAL